MQRLISDGNPFRSFYLRQAQWHGFERPDLVARGLAGEPVPTTPLEALRAAGWNPGPLWDGSPAVLAEAPEHARPAIDAPAATLRTDVPLFIPGPAITDGLEESAALLDEMVDVAAEHQQRTGVTPLWGTANLFSHPRYQAGAATNPDPEVFAYAAAQVAHCLAATHRLGGQNYVLWGGREGYDTLLNTDVRRELDQLGRFLSLVVEHKHRIGFDGTILIEPKPFEPTKHQYDYDVAAVNAFLQRYDLAGEIKVNIEVNHATLSGHDFAHEVAVAVDAGIFGSVDANAGDDRLGWDVDRFPVSVEQMTLGMLEILRGGGLTTGGFTFDAKRRRQSIDRTDLFHGHVGGMDTLARALLVAAAILEGGDLDAERASRYAGWDGGLGRSILDGAADLAALHERALDRGEPTRVSGGQERLENLVARYVARVR